MGLKVIICCLCVIAATSDLVTMNGREYLKETVVLEDGTLAISFYPIQSEQEVRRKQSQSIQRSDYSSKQDQGEQFHQRQIEHRPGRGVGKGKRNRHSHKKEKESDQDQNPHNINLTQDQLFTIEDQITKIEENKDAVFTTSDFLNSFGKVQFPTKQNFLRFSPPHQREEAQEISIPAFSVDEDLQPKHQNIRSYRTTNIGEQKNDIMGEFNRIYGEQNKIRGDQNHITHNSYHNQVYGDNNYISGSGNIVYN